MAFIQALQVHFSMPRLATALSQSLALRLWPWLPSHYQISNTMLTTHAAAKGDFFTPTGKSDDVGTYM